MLIVKNCNDQ